MGVMDGYFARKKQMGSRKKAWVKAKQDQIDRNEAKEGYQAQIDAANDALDEYKKKVYDRVKSGEITEEAAGNQLQSYYAKYFQPAVKEPSYQLDLYTSDKQHWVDWKNINTVEGLINSVVMPEAGKVNKRLQEDISSKGKLTVASQWLEYTRESLNSVATLDKAGLLPDNIKKDFSNIKGDFRTAMQFAQKHKDWIRNNNVSVQRYTWTQGNDSKIGPAALEWFRKNNVSRDRRASLNKINIEFNSANNEYFSKNFPPTVSTLFKTTLKDYNYGKGQVSMIDGGKEFGGPHLDQLIKAERKAVESYEKSFKTAFGPTWTHDSRMANYVKSGEMPNITQALVSSVPQFDINTKEALDYRYSVYASNYDYNTGKFSPKQRSNSGGINVFGKGGILRGGSIIDAIGDIGEIVVKTGFNIVTKPFEAPVAIIEGIDDIIDGDKSVGTALWDMTKQSFGVNDLEDMVDNFKDGNYVDAALNAAEFSANVAGGGPLQTDVTGADSYFTTAGAIADEIEKQDEGVIGDLKEGIDENVLEPVLEATGLIPPMEEETPTGEGFDMDTSDINTLKQLKELLGILPGDDGEGVVIDALLGAERDEKGFFKKPSVEKMASNLDIMNVLGQQRQVAETGYDAGERETLSSRARRELAGRARAGGMAAGAAAGGLRGASVGAQARSLEEKAMQQQADVTTEMDKASIARKDAARQALANLAKDVTRFDIEKAEELKKRKGATAIGVQSLISQEELMKKQLELAAKP